MPNTEENVTLNNLKIVIDCKKSWDYPFTWEDKMILINDQYSILGRCLAARVNDIINFNIYSYT